MALTRIGDCGDCGTENVPLREPDRLGGKWICDPCHKYDTLDYARAALQAAQSAIDGKGDVERAIVEVENALEELVWDFPFTFALADDHPTVRANPQLFRRAEAAR